MTAESVARDRLRLLPPIRRARLWRLYAEDGRRFLDFWMDGGRSILGAKGTGIGTIAKASIDMGLTRPFPSIWEARLRKLILERHVDYVALRFYRDEERAIAAAAAILPAGERLGIIRPFAEYFQEARGPSAEVTLSDIGGEAATLGAAMLLLPSPTAFSPAVLLFKDSEAAASASGDIVPPLALACAHRALCEFDRFKLDYSEALWKKVDRRLAPYFERRGPYLRLRTIADKGWEDAYDRLFRAALGAGILLSPYPELPSIVPGDFDDGELARLAKALGSLKE